MDLRCPSFNLCSNIEYLTAAPASETAEESPKMPKEKAESVKKKKTTKKKKEEPDKKSKNTSEESSKKKVPPPLCPAPRPNSPLDAKAVSKRYFSFERGEKSNHGSCRYRNGISSLG